MSFQRLQCSLLASFMLLSAGAAQAADYAPPPPPMMVQQPAEEFASSWYLRGHVGVGIMTSNLVYLPNPVNVGNGFVFDHSDMSDAFFIGGGFGYEWNNWFRTDLTLDYHSKAHLFARGTYDLFAGDGDEFQGFMSSWVGLANAYVDLGTWNCITPFVGVGAGFALNKISDFVDQGINHAAGGRGFGRDSSKFNFAWAAHAGLAFAATKNLKIELAYRMLNLGSVTETVDCFGGCHPDSFRFEKIVAHDIMLALRWNITDVAVATPAPTYVAPPVYTQPPVYSPPPLRSRG
jgi:opacity protein-like surface antigen